MRRTLRHARTLLGSGSSRGSQCDEEEPVQDQGDHTEQSDQVGQTEEVQLHFRGATGVPPARPYEKRAAIVPNGNAQWRLVDFDPKEHLPNGVLGTLIRHHYPGMIEVKGQRVACRKWNEYKHLKIPQFGTLANRVEADFWERFKVSEDLKSKASEVLNAAAKELTKNMMYQARIQAIVEYHRRVQKIPMTEKQARDIDLTAEQYMEAMPWWMQKCPDAWEYLSRMWEEQAWKAKSAKHMANRTKAIGASHRQGSDSLTHFHQKMSVQEQRDVTVVEAFAKGHRGTDPTHSKELCSPHATRSLSLYRDGMVAAHGEEINWMEAPLDTDVLCKSTGGKAHGRCAIANGFVDDSVSLSASQQVSSSQLSREQERQYYQQLLRNQKEKFERLRQADREEYKQSISAEVTTQVSLQFSQIYGLLSQKLRPMGVDLPPMTTFIPNPTSPQGTSGSAAGLHGSIGDNNYGDRSGAHGDDEGNDEFPPDPLD